MVDQWTRLVMLFRKVLWRRNMPTDKNGLDVLIFQNDGRRHAYSDSEDTPFLKPS